MLREHAKTGKSPRLHADIKLWHNKNCFRNADIQNGYFSLYLLFTENADFFMGI